VPWVSWIDIGSGGSSVDLVERFQLIPPGPAIRRIMGVVMVIGICWLFILIKKLSRGEWLSESSAT